MELTMSNDYTADGFMYELEKLKKLRVHFPNLNLVNQKWEVLNFIASYRYRGQKVCVSDVYHGLDYPRESVIRTIDMLVRLGIVVKSTDKIDKRRKYIRLTEKTKKLFDEMSNSTEQITA